MSDAGPFSLRSIFQKALHAQNYAANRRKLNRKPLMGPLEIFSRDASAILGKGYVMNLHEEGMGIVTENELQQGDEVLLNFGLPNGWKLDFRGTVVHQEKGEYSTVYGVKFAPGQSTFILKIV